MNKIPMSVSFRAARRISSAMQTDSHRSFDIYSIIHKPAGKFNGLRNDSRLAVCTGSRLHLVAFISRDKSQKIMHDHLRYVITLIIQLLIAQLVIMQSAFLLAKGMKI